VFSSGSATCCATTSKIGKAICRCDDDATTVCRNIADYANAMTHPVRVCMRNPARA
jgi:hypothetical protein